MTANIPPYDYDRMLSIAKGYYAHVKTMPDVTTSDRLSFLIVQLLVELEALPYHIHLEVLDTVKTMIDDSFDKRMTT